MPTNIRFPAALVALVVCSLPARAAVLSVNVETPNYFCSGQDQTVFLDVFVTDVDNTDERLDAFTVAVNGVGFSPTGMRFLPVQLPSTAHPFVFKDTPATLTEIGSTFNRVQVAGTVDMAEGEANVTPANNGLFRIPVFVPATTPPGLYPVAVDLASTQFAGKAGTITVTQGQVSVNMYMCPEPSAAALLGAPGPGTAPASPANRMSGATVRSSASTAGDRGSRPTRRGQRSAAPDRTVPGAVYLP